MGNWEETLIAIVVALIVAAYFTATIVALTKKAPQGGQEGDSIEVPAEPPSIQWLCVTRGNGSFVCVPEEASPG